MRVLVKRLAGRRLGALIVGLVMVGVGLGSGTGSAALATQTRTGAPGPAIALAGHKGGKLSPRLLALSRNPHASALSLPSSGAGSLVRHGERPVVQIRMSDVSPAAVARLTASGVHVISTSTDYSTVTADVAPADLDKLANNSEVTYVGEVLAPRSDPTAKVSAGAATVAVGSERGASTSPTYVTSGSLASVSRSAVATSAVTVEYSGLVLITCTPRAVSRATAAGDVSDMRICTIGRPP